MFNILSCHSECRGRSFQVLYHVLSRPSVKTTAPNGKSTASCQSVSRDIKGKEENAVGNKKGEINKETERRVKRKKNRRGSELREGERTKERDGKNGRGTDRQRKEERTEIPKIPRPTGSTSTASC